MVHRRTLPSLWMAGQSLHGGRQPKTSTGISVEYLNIVAETVQYVTVRTKSKRYPFQECPRSALMP